jgi:hypothetical protein
MMTFQERGIRLLITAAAFAVFLASNYYYWAFLARNQQAARMGALVRDLEAKFESKTIKPATQRYIMQQYWADIAKARASFLVPGPYWKNIDEYYYLAARSWLREGRIKDALATLRQGMAYHPFLMNNYKMLWYLYESLQADDRARSCREIYEGILSGAVLGREAGCACLSFEGCP